MGELSDMKFAQRLAGGGDGGEKFDTSSAGIAGLMKRQQERQQQTEQLTASAFGDIETLMEK